MNNHVTVLKYTYWKKKNIHIGWFSAHTFWPSSQLIHKSPRVRKHATACRARWWIHPSRRSCVMMASMKGNPVRAWIHKHLFWTNLLFTTYNKDELKSHYLSPCSQVLRIIVPVHLDAVRVAFHLVEVWNPGSGGVEELSPEQLSVQRHRRMRVLLLQQVKTLLTILACDGRMNV